MEEPGASVLMCNCEKNHSGWECGSRNCMCHTQDWTNIYLMVTSRNVPQNVIAMAALAEAAKDLAGDGVDFSLRCDRLRLDEDDESEDLYHDDNTMLKVYGAVRGVLRSLKDQDPAAVDAIALDIVSNMQNAGILFRERR